MNSFRFTFREATCHAQGKWSDLSARRAIALSSILNENPSACDSAVNPQYLNWYNLLLSNMELLSHSSQIHFLDLCKNICAKWHEAMLQ